MPIFITPNRSRSSGSTSSSRVTKALFSSRRTWTATATLLLIVPGVEELMNVVVRGPGLYRLNEFQILFFFCNHLPDRPEPSGTAAGAREWLCPGAPTCFRSGNILFARQEQHGKTGVNRTLQDRGTDTHPPVCCRATSGNNNCSCRGDRDLKTSCITLPAPACQRRFLYTTWPGIHLE